MNYVGNTSEGLTMTESQLKGSTDPKTFSITLTADQRKLLTYTAIALGGYFLARHLVNSAVDKLNKE